MEGHHTTMNQTTNVGKEITQYVRIDPSTLAGMVLTIQKKLMQLLPLKYSQQTTLRLHSSSIVFATLNLDMGLKTLVNHWSCMQFCLANNFFSDFVSKTIVCKPSNFNVKRSYLIYLPSLETRKTSIQGPGEFKIYIQTSRSIKNACYQALEAWFCIDNA